MNIPMMVCGIEEVHLMTVYAPKRMVSLLDPGLMVDSLPSVESRLALTMLDITNPKSAHADAPSIEHVQALLNFGGQGAFKSDSMTLVCCRAGVSRSTAAALILVAQRYGAEGLPEAVDWLLSIRPEADPNTRLLMLGDQVLNLPGSLMRAGQSVKRRQRARSVEWM